MAQTIAQDQSGNSAVRFADGGNSGGSTGIKNIAAEIPFSFQDPATPVSGSLRIFVGIADSTADDTLYSDARAPVGSLYIRLTTQVAGATTAAGLYFKKVTASSGVSGFTLVTQA